jgi:TRAP-type uncharacterized transport system fused permease subunit
MTTKDQPKKRNKIFVVSASIGIFMGFITVSGLVYSFTSNTLDKKIDDRIDNKLKYIILLLQEIATPEQKDKADQEYKRWNTD